MRPNFTGRFTEERTMKSHNAIKETKRKPRLTPKEKRTAKQLKKQLAQRPQAIIVH